MIKKLLLFTGAGAAVVITVLLFAGCSSLPGNAAASVNGVVITKDAVANRIRVIKGLEPQNVPSSTQGSDYNQLQRDVTEQLVSEELEKQLCQKRGITVAPQEVDPLVKQVVDDQYYGDANKMQQDFAKRGVSIQDLRDDLTRELLHKKLIASIGAEVPVTDAEVQAVYNKNKNSYVYPEKRQVRQIVVADQATAQQVETRLANGTDFATLAAQVSIDSSTKSKGGLVGLVTQTALPAEIGQAAFSMQRNQVSGPIKSTLGWYIIKVDLIQPASNRTYDQVKDQLKQMLQTQKMSKHYQDVTQQFKNSSDVEFAAGFSPRAHTAPHNTGTAAATQAFTPQPATPAATTPAAPASP